MSVASIDDHPLGIELTVEEPFPNPPKGEKISYRPAANMKVAVCIDTNANPVARGLVLANGGLGDYVLSDQVEDGELVCKYRGIHPLFRKKDNQPYLILKTDSKGKARARFYLDFSRLAAAHQVITRKTPLKVALEFAAVTPLASGQLKGELWPAGFGRYETDVDYIAVISALVLRRAGAYADKPEGVDLSAAGFKEDPGFLVGDKRLFGRERARLHRYYTPVTTGGFTTYETSIYEGDGEVYAEQGATLGVGDSITAITEGLYEVDPRPENSVPGWKPGELEISLQYLDGMEGSVTFDGKMFKERIFIGPTQSSAGFNWSHGFMYAASKKVVLWSVNWFLPTLKVVTLPISGADTVLSDGYRGVYRWDSDSADATGDSATSIIDWLWNSTIGK